jgi:DNA-binding PadR family transcriptional regulator
MFEQRAAADDPRSVDDPSERVTLKEIETRVIKTFLDILILQELKRNEDSSGYDIIKFVRDKLDTTISSGTVYSALYAIERKGLIRGVTDRRRTGYALTKLGNEYLNTIQDSENKLSEFIKDFFNL